MMVRKCAVGVVAVLLAVAGVGCSAGGAASTGFSMFKNTRQNKLDVTIYLDNQEAKRNEMMQAAAGHSKWKIKEPVSTNPTFRYDVKDAATTGRISNTTLTLYKKVGKKMSTQPEYTIVSTSTEAAGQMQPGQSYSLASPGAGFRTMDWQNKQVAGATLEPNTEYMLQFSIRADQSETAQIYFATR